MWASGGWKRKVRMQYLLFPKGLNYNKRNDIVRTEKINQAFLWMACQQQKICQNKKRNTDIKYQVFRFCGSGGIRTLVQTRN